VGDPPQRYFNHPEHVKNALGKLEARYHPDDEAALLEVLQTYATRRADEKAAAEGGDEQATLFDPEDEAMPF
jgi:hypothetical protein